jgi:hypothetical protein
MLIWLLVGFLQGIGRASEPDRSVSTTTIPPMTEEMNSADIPARRRANSAPSYDEIHPSRIPGTNNPDWDYYDTSIRNQVPTTERGIETLSPRTPEAPLRIRPSALFDPSQDWSSDVMESDHVTTNEFDTAFYTFGNAHIHRSRAGGLERMRPEPLQIPTNQLLRRRDLINVPIRDVSPFSGIGSLGPDDDIRVPNDIKIESWNDRIPVVQAFANEQMIMTFTLSTTSSSHIIIQGAEGYLPERITIYPSPTEDDDGSGNAFSFAPTLCDLSIPPYLIPSDPNAIIGAGPGSAFSIDAMPFVIVPPINEEARKIIIRASNQVAECLPESISMIHRSEDGWTIYSQISIQDGGHNEITLTPTSVPSTLETYVTDVEVSSSVDYVPTNLLQDIILSILIRNGGSSFSPPDEESQGAFYIEDCHIERFPTLGYRLFHYGGGQPNTQDSAANILLYPEDYVSVEENRCKVHLAAISPDMDNRIVIGSNIFQNAIGIFTFDRIGFCDPV